MTSELRAQIRRDAIHRSVSSSDALALLDELERVEAALREATDRYEAIIVGWMDEVARVVAERDALRAALREINLQTGIENARVIAFDALAAGSSQEHQHD